MNEDDLLNNYAKMVEEEMIKRSNSQFVNEEDQRFKDLLS